MCGLFGMIGPGIARVDYKIIDELMLVSSLRGEDGTGVVSGSSHGKHPRSTLYKIPGDPFYWRTMLVSKAKIESALYDIHNNWVIGHVRKPTSGSIDQKATQPFTHANVMGCHNGGIRGDIEGFASDSAKLYAYLNHFKGDVKKAFDALEIGPFDAYALVWFDVNTRKVNFLRNGKRKLYVGFNKQRSVMYWASEYQMLNLVLDRNDVEYELLYLTEDTLYSVDPSKISSKKTTEEFSRETIKPSVLPPPPYVIDENVIELPNANSNGSDIPWIQQTQDKTRIVN